MPNNKSYKKLNHKNSLKSPVFNVNITLNKENKITISYYNRIDW
jgi:hypothetical protein